MVLALTVASLAVAQPAFANSQTCEANDQASFTACLTQANAADSDIEEFVIDVTEDTVISAELPAFDPSLSSRKLKIIGTAHADARTEISPATNWPEHRFLTGVADRDGEIVIENLAFSGFGFTVGANVEGGTIRLEHNPLTIDNSSIMNSKATGAGGAIRNARGVVTIADSSLTGNSASTAGAISTSFSNIMVTDSDLSNNVATSSDGGAIRTNFVGTTTVVNSTLSNNTAADGSGGAIKSSSNTSAVSIGSTFSNNSAGSAGGAISSDTNTGGITATDTIFDSNTASQGGAIGTGGHVNLTGSTLTGNSASLSGGAVYSTGFGVAFNVTRTVLRGNSITGSEIAGGAMFVSHAHIVLDRSAVVANTLSSGNSAGKGGGIYGANSKITVRNSTVANNVVNGNLGSVRQGGGIATNSGYIELEHATLANNGFGENVDGSTKGASFYSGTTRPSSSYASLIVASSSNGLKACDGVLVKFQNSSYTRISDESCDLTTSGTIVANWTGGMQALADDVVRPSLGPDTAINQLPENVCVHTEDQRGMTRPTAGQCDLGAVESQFALNLTVTPVAPTVFRGSAAAFTVTVRNDSDVVVPVIAVDSPQAADCVKTLTDLGPGDETSYTCEQPAVTEDFAIDVTATVDEGDIGVPTFAASDSSVVQVQEPPATPAPTEPAPAEPAVPCTDSCEPVAVPECPSGSCAGEDLTGIDLSDRILTGVDFSDATLVGADLRDLTCIGCNFESAKFSAGVCRGDVDPARPNCRRGANLSRANFTGSNFRRADLTATILTKTRFTKANLAHAKLKAAHAPSAKFDQANLRRVKAHWLRAVKADFRQSDLTKANFSYTNVREAMFRGATTHTTVFKGVRGKSAPRTDWPQ